MSKGNSTHDVTVPCHDHYFCEGMDSTQMPVFTLVGISDEPFLNGKFFQFSPSFRRA